MNNAFQFVALMSDVLEKVTDETKKPIEQMIVAVSQNMIRYTIVIDKEEA